MTRRRISRVIAGLIAAVAVVVVLPTAAAADPAGPTDYQTEILSIEPNLDEIEVAILGGDSFMELTVSPGTAATVNGYEDEPYLVFEADGTVLENENSPTRWQNEDRLGDIETPATANAEAEPAWVEVSDDGVYAWHDHRAHWMSSDKPIGAEPGDPVIDQRQIFFTVEPAGQAPEEVAVEIRSTLLAPPSPLAAALGAVAGLLFGGLALAYWLSRGRTGAGLQVLALVTLACALAATYVGRGAVGGLPAEAAPGLATWALPLVAAAALALALIVDRAALVAPSLAALLVPGALVLAGAELLIWVWLRREALVRSLIPTEAPMWLDRGTLSASAVIGVAAVAAAMVALGAGPRLTTPTAAATAAPPA